LVFALKGYRPCEACVEVVPIKFTAPFPFDLH
jgi:hypothetical protein